MKRKLIVISGASATGKTTLGVRLQKDLGVPLIAKDDIKEMLFDTLPQSDRKWSKMQGRMAIAMMFAGARVLLDHGEPVAIESVFDREKAREDIEALSGDGDVDTMEVHCYVSEPVRQHRWRHRVSVSRHAGHLDGAVAPVDVATSRPIYPDRAISIDTGAEAEIYESSCKGLIEHLSAWLKEGTE